MAVHTGAALHNVSCATGTFAAQLRGSGRPSATRTQMIARGHACNALMTYNRRASASAISSVLATHRAAAGQLSAATRASIARISHVARPRFNALQRLASSALSSRGNTGSHHVVQAAALAEAPTAPAQQLQPGVQLKSAFGSSQLLPEIPSFGRGGCDLGYPTNFEEDWELGEEIGSGSFGTVFMATSTDDGEEVAVKVLPKEPATHGRQRRGSGRAGRDIHLAKIQKELMILKKLQRNGNAIELKGVYEDRHSVYIVMEECLGGDLEQLMDERGPLTERQAALIMYEALQTLAACHEQHIYHGDVKPANFMLKADLPEQMQGALERLRPGTWLKAIDFGCAQPVTPGVPLTRKTGTPMFMAPEVFIGNYSVEADVWAAGMMLYQLIADRFPFWQTMEELHTTTLEEVMQAVIQRDIPLDYGVWKDVSPECLDFIRCMLTRDPAQRISAAEAMQHAWFRHFGIGENRPDMDRSVSGNVVPMSRGMSETLRLRMCGAELNRAATRQPTELSGLLDAMLSPCEEENLDVRASC